MKQHSEFVIIGGGVLGASLAYQLSLHGREVLLLEQNEICSGTSSGTVAWIGPFDRQPLFMEELAMMLSGSSPRRMPGKRNRPCGATV